MTEYKRPIVVEWDVVVGGILGAVIFCEDCHGIGTARASVDHACSTCDGDRMLHRPYRLPNGAQIDLERDAAILVQIQPNPPACPSGGGTDG